MKTIGLILFLMANGIFVSVLAFVENNSNTGLTEKATNNLAVQWSNNILDSTGIEFQTHSMLDVIVVFLMTAVFFLVGIYLIFEIFLFINFIGNRNKKLVK